MLDEFVTNLASQSGFSEDVLRFLLGFLFEIPVSIGLRYLPNNPSLKHAIYGIVGIFVSLFVYSGMTLNVLISMVPVYFIMKYMPNRIGAYISFGVCLSYLMYLHITRMVDNYLGYDLDFSSVQMVLVIKYSTFAFSVSNANDSEYQFSKYTKEHVISKYPTYLEFFGYTFFYPAFFSGPSLEFNDYMKFVTMEQFKEFDHKLPKIDVSALLKVIGTIIVLVTFFILSGVLDIFNYCDYYLVRNPKECSCWYKLLLVLIYVDFVKVKYYFTWKFAELLSVLSGFGYSGQNDGKLLWNGFKNVDIWKMETSNTVRQIVSNWNIQTERWLRYYIYERLAQSKQLSAYKTLFTNMVSAVWHGLYPGYYIAFGSLTLHTKFQTALHKQVLPLLTEKFGDNSYPILAYKIFNYIYTPFAVMYCFISFVLLSFSATWDVYSNSYFIPHLFAGVVLTYLTLFPIYHKKSPQSTYQPSGSPQIKNSEKTKDD
ncbi:Membrane-bound O-acyltransferase (MBOAT) family protein [Entamoeba marina]